MSSPYNAKNAASVLCESITRYTGGYAFVFYTAFGMGAFFSHNRLFKHVYVILHLSFVQVAFDL